MSSTTRRFSLVLVLIGLTGLACAAVRPPNRQPLGLPSSSSLLAGSDWRVLSAASAPYGEGNIQWSLREPGGAAALLFVESTNKVQTMLEWSGVLGFEGDGYLVRQSGTRSLRLGDGTSATVGTANVRQLTNQLAIASAVVGPDGIMAHGADYLVRTGWEALRGTDGPYYLVRVATPTVGSNSEAERIAGALLARVLPALRARIRADVK